MTRQKKAESYRASRPIDLHYERPACSSCAALGVSHDAACVHFVIPGDNLGPQWQDYRLEVAGCPAPEVVPPGAPFCFWGDHRFILWRQRLYYSDAACYGEVAWKPGMPCSEWRLQGLHNEPRPEVWKALSDGLDRLMLGTGAAHHSDGAPGDEPTVRVVEQVTRVETEVLDSHAHTAGAQPGWSGRQLFTRLTEYKMSFDKLRRHTLSRLKA